MFVIGNASEKSNSFFLDQFSVILSVDEGGGDDF